MDKQELLLGVWVVGEGGVVNVECVARQGGLGTGGTLGQMM